MILVLAPVRAEEEYWADLRLDRRRHVQQRRRRKVRRISASRHEYTTAFTSELASARSRKYFSTARTLQDLQSRPSSSSTTWPGVQHTTNAPVGQTQGVGLAGREWGADCVSHQEACPNSSVLRQWPTERHKPHKRPAWVGLLRGDRHLFLICLLA